eukprot:jgi/Chrzof1/3689/Cz13g05080.t1
MQQLHADEVAKRFAAAGVSTGITMATLLREGCGRVTSSVNESAKAVHFVAAGVMNLALPPAKAHIEPLLQMELRRAALPSTHSIEFSSTKRGYRQRRRSQGTKTRAFRHRASEFQHAQEHVFSDSTLIDTATTPVVHNLRDCRQQSPPAGPSPIMTAQTSSSAPQNQQGVPWMFSLALQTSML